MLAARKTNSSVMDVF